MATTCIRYLMLWIVNTVLSDALPPVRYWTGEHFSRFAQHLNELPLASYALNFLAYHLRRCQHPSAIVGLMNQFIANIETVPARCLLHRWLPALLRRQAQIIDPKEAIWFNTALLFCAVQKNFSTAVETLLITAAQINSRGPEGKTPLLLAAVLGHERIVELLLGCTNLQADVADAHGRTPLSMAAAAGHDRIVGQLLARNDVSADSKDEYGRTPLWWAASAGHWKVVQMLHPHGSHASSILKNVINPLTPDPAGVPPRESDLRLDDYYYGSDAVHAQGSLKVEHDFILFDE